MAGTVRLQTDTIGCQEHFTNVKDTTGKILHSMAKEKYQNKHAVLKLSLENLQEPMSLNYIPSIVLQL
jgi:hypothetical protein